MTNRTHRSRLPLFAGISLMLALLLLTGAFFGRTRPAAAAGHAVTIANFAFGPATLTINVGDTVTWTNSDQATHTSTADNGAWDSGQIATGQSFSQTFTTAGTFTYHCAIHPNMHGTIVVQAAAAAAPASSAPAPAAASSGNSSAAAAPASSSTAPVAAAPQLPSTGTGGLLSQPRDATGSGFGWAVAVLSAFLLLGGLILIAHMRRRVSN